MVILGMGTYMELQNKMNALRAQKMTWEEIGDLIGISAAFAWRVAHGKSDSHKARAYFGLPPKLVEVVPCSQCGEVHTKKTCTAGHTRPRYRLALEFDNQDDQRECAELMALYLAPSRLGQSQYILNVLRRFDEYGN
jgi:hypothetical protein